MEKERIFKIIAEGQKDGISKTCRKYEISRTLYYRWLNRYKMEGIDGLDRSQKVLIPPNKTDSKLEDIVVKVSLTYPSYGPKAVMYLLEEMGYSLSESAVYNILKRSNIPNKKSRMEYLSHQKKIKKSKIFDLDNLRSGELLVFWITDYGYFNNIGKIYEYTIFEYKSRIACTRLFNEISYNHFKNLLTDVAMPVGKSLSFDTAYIGFFENSEIIGSKKNINKEIKKINSSYNYGIDIHFINSSYELQQLNASRKHYTEMCLSSILKICKSEPDFEDLKQQFQRSIINYNINDKSDFNGEMLTPIEHHIKLTNSEFILPLWAYIERPY